MALRVGFLSVAHMHAWGYVGAFKSHPEAELVGVWDDNSERAQEFASKNGIKVFSSASDLLGAVDAVVVTSENKRHAELVALAAQAGKHILCEKPLVTTPKEEKAMRDAVDGQPIRFMTAFPCRFAPSWARLKERVANGDIGPIRAVCATNRGRCPFDWFVEKDKSGGGSMIDHVVHVADLLWDLLREEPARVQAQTGNNMYGQDWEDTAMVTIEYDSGIFASLDSSWSRPGSFKTWGDVTMNVVGEKGVLELDMFGQEVDVFGTGEVTHRVAGYGSSLDAALVESFVRCVLDGTEPAATLKDGLRASRVAMAGYRSVGAVEVVAV